MDFNIVKDLLSTKTLLYVEDEKNLQSLYKDMFEILFSKVVIADNGQEAFEAYTQEKFDIVLTDIRMPIMDGCELLNKIKDINPNQKIFAMSGEHSKHIANSSEFDAWIRKPATLESILSVFN